MSGLAVSPVGVLRFSVRVIDAGTFPIMGGLADGTRSRYRRFRRWMLCIAFPSSLFNIFMLSPPEWTYNS
ncbi:MFS transporter, partial [Klebsiella pneumoniae]|uniref:MFS transporter n=1 Tax=Klebsiella pneumoniae TaxID=573 RepID=UPI0010251862